MKLGCVSSYEFEKMCTYEVCFDPRISCQQIQEASLILREISGSVLLLYCVHDCLLDILQIRAISSLNSENAKDDTVFLPENLQLKYTGRLEVFAM